MAELSRFDEEIMVEILSRLPPKSLMRFKCVRRSWNGLINNNNFAAKHLSASKRTTLSSSSTTVIFRRFLIADVSPNEMEMVLSLFKIDNGFEGCFLEDVHFPHSMDAGCRGKINPAGYSTFNISCYCDGIICLDDAREGSNIILCNPAIKEFRLLPEPQLSSPKYPGSPTAAVGFGYDIGTKTYKVVRLVHTGWEYCKDQNIDMQPLKAEVFDLLTNSWKEIKVDGLLKENSIILPDSNAQTGGLYFAGFLYWCAMEQGKVVEFVYDEHGDEQAVNEYHARIITFDLGNEAFHVMNINTGLYVDCCLMGGVLGLWKESIALCLRGWTTLDIWVMDDHGGGKGSWTKYLALEPVVKITAQFALFGKSDDHFVLVACDHCAVIFYDIFTNKFMYLPLNDVRLNYTQVVEYFISIVSVKEGN